MDGKIATVNGFLGEIEVPGSDGTVYHVSFEDAALEAASGDPALADQIVADMVDFSTNPQNLMTITPSIVPRVARSEEHTSELQSLMRISYAVFCLKKKKQKQNHLHKATKHQQTLYIHTN